MSRFLPGFPALASIIFILVIIISSRQFVRDALVTIDAGFPGMFLDHFDQWPTGQAIIGMTLIGSAGVITAWRESIAVRGPGKALHKSLPDQVRNKL
jgi:hypothetical protein